MSATRRWTGLLLVTFLLAGLLRLIGLQSGLWFDEILTLVASARHPFWAILTEFPNVNGHPLYNLLAHASIVTFGDSAWALRLPACIFGIASVIMVYVLGAHLTTRLEGWAGAAFLATSYHHIWFSQNGRGYTLLGFLTLLSTYFLLRGCETGRRRDYISYALGCAIGIYAHLTMVLVMAGHAAVILVGRALRWRPSQGQPLRPLLWAWIGAGVLAAAAYAPFAASLVAIAGGDLTRGAAKVATASWALGSAVQALLSGAGMPAVLAAVAFAAVGAVSIWRLHPLAFALLTVPGLVTGIPFVALGQPLRPRFFFFLSGAAAIFVGRGIGTAVRAFTRHRTGDLTVGERRAILVCTLGLMLVSAIALPQNYRLPKQDFDGAVQFLDEAEAQGAAIVASGPACMPVERYYVKTWRCLKSIDDLRSVRAVTGRVLVVYTLVEYVEDPQLLASLRSNCPIVRRFAGTLTGGDVIVCEPQRTTASAVTG